MTVGEYTEVQRRRLIDRGECGRIVPYDSSLWPRYSEGCRQIINIPVSRIPALKENVSNTLWLQADVNGDEEWDECFGLVHGGPIWMEGNSTADLRMLRAPPFPASTGLQWFPYTTSTYKSKFYYPIVYMLRQGDKFTFTLRSCTVDMVLQNECLNYVMARKLDRFYFHHIAGIQRL